MSSITVPLTYVALSGEYPIAAGRDLVAVQAYAVAREPQKDYHTGEQREFRWDETHAGNSWHLMARNQRTNRWGKTHVAVRTAVLVGDL